jgi:hypothetical protein
MITEQVSPVRPKNARPMTSDEKVLSAKSHPKVFAAFECWSKLADKSRADASCKTSGGMIEVDLVLGDGAVGSFDALGFVAEGKAVRNHLRGKIAVAKLPELAKLEPVKFIGWVH